MIQASLSLEVRIEPAQPQEPGVELNPCVCVSILFNITYLTFIVEDDVHAGTERCAEEESRSESLGGSRKRFKLAVAMEQ